MSGWRLAPGVVRLPSGRISGGAPMRVLRLSAAGDRVLTELLGTAAVPTGATAELAERLVGYGLLLRPRRAPVSPAGVTVVIPALSTASAVRAVLDAVPEDVPVVVVDDGSDPPLEGALPERVRVLRHETPRGPAAARNAGAARADTAWIAFLDADLEPEPGWLEALMAYADPEVTALAPRIVSSPGHGPGAWLERAAGALDQGRVASDVGPGRLVSYLPSAALLIRHETFSAAGGFDESLRVGEDVDLVWRIKGRIRYEPDVVLPHRPRGSLRAVLHRRFDYGTSAALLERRHPGSLRHADVSVWAFVPWALGVAVHPVAGAAAAAGSVAVAGRTMTDLPRPDAHRLAARGQAMSAAGLGRWLVRPLWPVWVLLLLTRRRKVVLAAALAGWVSLARKGRNPAAAVVDDAAYSLGVWAGCARERIWTPLLPRVRRSGR